MRIYLEGKDGSVSKPNSLEGLSVAGAGLLWIDLQGASAEEVERVGGLIGAHPLALDYCKAADAQPKVQEYDDHLFLAWSFIGGSDDSGHIERLPICVFLGRNYLVTVHDSELDGLEDIMKKLDSDPSIYKHQPAIVLYSILDESVDEYFPIVDDITNRADAYLDELLSGDGKGLQDILALKHRNMGVRRMVAAQRDVILKLARRDMPFIPQDLGPYMFDIYDILTRVVNEVESNADLITSCLDINLNVASNRLNVVMKKLTLVATIFLPLTFLVGLYGMNFRHMPELTWKYGYLMAWIALVLIGLATYFYARWFIEREPPRTRRKRGGRR